MNKYISPASASVHQLMSEIYEARLIDKKTMQHFDQTCLTTVTPLAPEEIRQLRERENISQSVFAHYLNISANQLSEWERGVKKPSGTALKLLSLVQHKGLDAIA